MTQLSVRVLASAILAAALVAPAAIAFPAERGDSVTVRYADLDLASAAGAKALGRRVDAAVVQVCGTADLRAVHDYADMMRCRRTTAETARPQVETALATARSGTNYADKGGVRVLARGY